MSVDLDEKNFPTTEKNKKNESSFDRSQFRDNKHVDASTKDNTWKISDGNENCNLLATVTDVKNNMNSTTRRLDSPKIVESFDYITDLNEIHQILHISGEDDHKREINDKRDDCADECFCKIKQGVGLITEEIKKVDNVIKILANKGECLYSPSANDKREFAKSVEKNSSVCHVIIQELKSQRMEIDEMLKLYETSTRDFAKLESTLNCQREKIQHIETVLVSIEDIVENVKIDIKKRHENFFVEMEKVRDREEMREEILKTFIHWISSLDAKRIEDSEKFDLQIEDAISERNEDRSMLTLAIKQLQEVRKIEMLINMQRSMTKNEEGAKVENDFSHGRRLISGLPSLKQKNKKSILKRKACQS